MFNRSRFKQHYVVTAFIALLSMLVLTLSGCMTTLAPPYDKVVTDELIQVNTEVMSVFASLSNGTQADTFTNRESRYNSLIGKLDALVIQAGARPMPKNKVTDKINAMLQSRGVAPITDDGAELPSVVALRKVSETLSKLRDTDRKQGVTSMEVRLFKGQVAIYLDQAITYENFLQR